MRLEGPCYIKICKFQLISIPSLQGIDLTGAEIALSSIDFVLSFETYLRRVSV